MHQRMFFSVLVILGIMTTISNAATLSGTVKSSDNKAIAGAVCSLLVDKAKTTTNAEGAFTMTPGTAIRTSFFKPQGTAVTLNKGILNFSLAKTASVRVTIFDVKGNLLSTISRESAQAGYYRFDVAGAFRTTQLLVIKVAIGQETMTFRHLPLSDNSIALTTAAAYPVTQAKITAVIDSLKVSATGYTTKIMAITKYDTTINVVLVADGGDDVLAVRLDQEKQTIQGFGINACLMSGSIFNIDQCFGTTGTDALGMSILRIGMNKDGEHRDVPSGWEKARTQYNAKIIGSCWSAPGDWKTNGQENDGGHLKTQYYTQWAERIANYAKKYNLYAMGIANEADFSSACAGKPPCTDHYASMTYTGKEMVAFVKEARKAFNKICPTIKMMAPEASLWIHVWSNISPTGIGVPGAPNGGYNSSDPHNCGCFSNDITAEAAAKCSEACKNGDGYDYGHWLAKDTAAWNSLDILGVHEYESQKAYAWPADVTNGKRTKEIWQTEMSGVMYWPEAGPTAHIENGVAVARWIQSALMVGEASAWCWWWYGAPYYTSDDNEGLALIKGSSQKTKRYYTYGNYSKYIRPGHKIVNITGTGKLPAKVLLTASKADDGTVVIVAVNETTSDQSVPVKISGGTAPASFKPIVTNGSVNWSEKTAVSVADGVLTMQLEKMSVTTFVGK
jgi:O-glycosyl hydrolase